MTIFHSLRRAVETTTDAINNSEPVRRFRESEHSQIAATAGVTAALASGLLMGIRRAHVPTVTATYPLVLIGLVATGVQYLDSRRQDQNTQQAPEVPRFSPPSM